MKKILFALALILSFGAVTSSTYAATIADKMAGHIVLQVESHGEGWYVDPQTKSRFFLYHAAQAYQIMREKGVGILNKDLQKIPVGFYKIPDIDTDHDGLADTFETAIGTDISKTDTDGDSLTDLFEVVMGMNPNGTSNLPLDTAFAHNNDGKILLQVESHGEGWWVNPADHKRYYLGRASDAYELMRSFGVGISNNNISLIPITSMPMNCADDFHCLIVALKLGQLGTAQLPTSTIVLKHSAAGYIFENSQTNAGTKTTCTFTTKDKLVQYLEHTETGKVTPTESAQCSTSN